MALFSWVPIFVDWANMTHSWGSKFVAIAFSYIIHTENRFFLGTRFCGSDPHSTQCHVKCIWYEKYKHYERPSCILSFYTSYYTMDGFIFVGTDFCGLSKYDTFIGFKIRGHSIFLHNSYRKLLFRGYYISWIGPSTKTTKIGTPRKLSHPQYM